MTAHDIANTAERGAYLFAGVAIVSLQQAAFILTIVSTLLAIVLGMVKLCDRIRYGPGKGA